MQRPLIAVVGYRLEPGQVRSWRVSGAVAAPDRYIAALHRADANEAVLMPNSTDTERARGLVSRFDGLMLIGGEDVDPSYYNEDRLPETRQTSQARDSFEIALTREAIDAGLPVLAICRGIQVLNVALGGTLVQHLSAGSVDHGDTLVPEHVMHPVRIESDSRLQRAMGVVSAECSSHHHQAVSRLGRDLIPCAWTSDGLVEGVELLSGWVVGVQWHPEVTAEDDVVQQGLFNSLVAKALDRM